MDLDVTQAPKPHSLAESAFDSVKKYADEHPALEAAAVAGVGIALGIAAHRFHASAVIERFFPKASSLLSSSMDDLLHAHAVSDRLPKFLTKSNISEKFRFASPEISAKPLGLPLDDASAVLPKAEFETAVEGEEKRQGYSFSHEHGAWYKELEDKVILHYPDRSSRIMFEDGRDVVVNKEGFASATLADGTKWTQNSHAIQGHLSNGRFLENGYGRWFIKAGDTETTHLDNGYEIVRNADGSVTHFATDGSSRAIPAGFSDRIGIEKSQSPEALAAFNQAKAAMEGAGLTPEKIAAGAVPENILGVGGNATVYNVPGLPDYVTKMSDWGGRGVVKAGDLAHPVVDVAPGENIGQAVAQLGDDGKTYLLKRQSGIASGGVNGNEYHQLGETEGNARYISHLKKVADMPQETYDEFAKTLRRLNDRNLSFDPSKTNNVLIDDVDKSFNVVDIGVSNTSRSGSSDMFTVLFNPGFRYNTAKNLEPTSELDQTVIHKILAAAKKHDLPLDISDAMVKWSPEANSLRVQQALDYQKSRPEFFQAMHDEVKSLAKMLDDHPAPSDMTPPPDPADADLWRG